MDNNVEGHPIPRDLAVKIDTAEEFKKRIDSIGIDSIITINEYQWHETSHEPMLSEFAEPCLMIVIHDSTSGKTTVGHFVLLRPMEMDHNIVNNEKVETESSENVLIPSESFIESFIHEQSSYDDTVPYREFLSYVSKQIKDAGLKGMSVYLFGQLLGGEVTNEEDLEHMSKRFIGRLDILTDLSKLGVVSGQIHDYRRDSTERGWDSILVEPKDRTIHLIREIDNSD